MSGTNFPGSLDTGTELPSIGPADVEDDPTKYHDVVHTNAHAAILALEAKVGIDGSADNTSMDYRLNRLFASVPYFEVQRSSTYTYTGGTTSVIFPFDTVIKDPTSGWNNTTKEFTVPETGLYYLEAFLAPGASNAATVHNTTITVNTVNSVACYFDADSSFRAPAIGLRYLTAGDVVSVYEYTSTKVYEWQSFDPVPRLVVAGPFKTTANASAYPQCEIVVVQHRQASGTSGGTVPTATMWATRPLNTLVQDDTGAASVASNTFTLPPGNWDIYASSSFYDIQRVRARLYNVTDSVTALLGSSEFTDANFSAGAVTKSEIFGTLVLTSPKTFRLDYYSQDTESGGYGLGVAVSTGDVEIFATVKAVRYKVSTNSAVSGAAVLFNPAGALM